MNRTQFLFLFLASTLVYIVGLFIPLMDVDAAQYASISREMFFNHSYLKVFNNGANYLDKPPLIFWLSVLSFKIFGISTFSYKLPSFLFTLLGVYSCFKLAKLLYSEKVALVAAIMLYTSQAFFLFNNDVRTDTVLTASVIFACWQLISFSEKKNFSNLIFGFLGVGFAMLAKGPIGAVVPASAIAFHFILKRRWKDFFQWQWIVGIAIALLTLVPMCIGLYQQFGFEGIKFFFWTQSFGRITGENVWQNNTGYFYFTHVILWSFLPWSLIFVIAFLFTFGTLIIKGFSSSALSEGYSIGGFLLPLVALSFSHYKLPHYIFVTYPLAVIFTSAYLTEWCSRENAISQIIKWIQLTLGICFTLAVLFMITQWFNTDNIFLWSIIFIGIIVFLYFIFIEKARIGKIVFASAAIAIMSNLILNCHIYPSLLKFQSGSQLAKIVNKEKVSSPVFFYDVYCSYAFEFYALRTAQNISIDKIVEMKNRGEEIWVVGDKKLTEDLSKKNISVKKKFIAEDFHITTLTFKFLFPATRQNELKEVYLIEI